MKKTIISLLLVLGLLLTSIYATATPPDITTEGRTAIFTAPVGGTVVCRSLNKGFLNEKHA